MNMNMQDLTDLRDAITAQLEGRPWQYRNYGSVEWNDNDETVSIDQLPAFLALERDRNSLRQQLAEAEEGRMRELNRINELHQFYSHIEREHAKAQSEAATLRERVRELEETLRIEKAVSEGIKRADQAVSSCGHNEQYLYSPDGVGKVILCSVCKMNVALVSLATVTAQAAVMREALEAASRMMRIMYPNSLGQTPNTAVEISESFETIRDALATDAGKELLEDRARLDFVLEPENMLMRVTNEMDGDWVTDRSAIDGARNSTSPTP